MLSTDKNASINVALVLRSELDDCLQDADGDSLAITQMKTHMKEQFDKRFPVTDLILAASIMDPRFMNLKIVDEELKRKDQNKIEFLSQMVLHEIKESDVLIASPPETSSSSSPAVSCDISALAAKHFHFLDNNSSIIEQECQA